MPPSLDDQSYKEEEIRIDVQQSREEVGGFHFLDPSSAACWGNSFDCAAASPSIIITSTIPACYAVWLNLAHHPSISHLIHSLVHPGRTHARRCLSSTWLSTLAHVANRPWPTLLELCLAGGSLPEQATEDDNDGTVPPCYSHVHAHHHHSQPWLAGSVSLSPNQVIITRLACLPASSSLDLGTYPPRLNLGIVLLQPPPLSSILSHPLLGLSGFGLVWSGLFWLVGSFCLLALHFHFLPGLLLVSGAVHSPQGPLLPTDLPLPLLLPLPLPSNLTSTTGRPPARRCLPLPPPVPPVTT